jgi:hypothetical protein
MGRDITELLREWPYDSDDNTRIVQTSDGRDVLQVRQPLGIEQYELDGRPDGARPFGNETVVDSIEERLETFKADNNDAHGFELTHEDCTLMQSEGILFYYRYLMLFQLGDFERVVRDTGHNLRICELLEHHCNDQDDRIAVLQFKPYIYRMNSIARAMTSIKKQEHDKARQIIQEAITVIQQMDEIDSPAFQFERVRSINYLKSALDQVKESEPDPVARLSAELKTAIDNEDYERAAMLRDRIRDLS